MQSFDFPSRQRCQVALWMVCCFWSFLDPSMPSILNIPFISCLLGLDSWCVRPSHAVNNCYAHGEMYTIRGSDEPQSTVEGTATLHRRTLLTRRGVFLSYIITFHYFTARDN